MVVEKKASVINL